MCFLHNELLGLQDRGDEVVEEFDVCFCNESFIFLYVFGEAKVGEKKEDGGGDARREENKSINCFLGDLLIFSFM